MNRERKADKREMEDKVEKKRKGKIEKKKEQEKEEMSAGKRKR